MKHFILDDEVAGEILQIVGKNLELDEAKIDNMIVIFYWKN